MKHENKNIKHLESRSLAVAMWGNLFMAAAGVVAATLSNSTAILMDGLFSLIGFVAALLGRRISQRISAGPDRIRPMGYAADEAIFLTFRSLSILGLILFASASAGMNIYRYLMGGPTPELHFGPMIIYFALIGATCTLLWLTHYFIWRRTGKVSEILRLEAKAAAFDGVITAAAGLGLGAVFIFRDGLLAPIVPIGDSIVVLLLCLTVLGQYMRGFRSSLGELAGVTANPEIVGTARRALRATVAEDGGTLVDLAVIKLGRSYLVSVYYEPGRPVGASDVDRLNLRMIRAVRKKLSEADVLLQISEYPRRWPDEVSPFVVAA